MLFKFLAGVSTPENIHQKFIIIMFIREQTQSMLLIESEDLS